jgi:hypothetical protein
MYWGGLSYPEVVSPAEAAPEEDEFGCPETRSLGEQTRSAPASKQDEAFECLIDFPLGIA